MDIDRAPEPPPADPTFVVPTPAATSARRPGSLTAAGRLLVVFGAIGSAAGALMLNQGSPTAGPAVSATHGAALMTFAIGGMEMIAGALVLRGRSVGRWMGFAFAVLGVVGAAIRLPSSPGAALIGLAVSGFIVYALSIGGAHFRATSPR